MNRRDVLEGFCLAGTTGFAAGYARDCIEESIDGSDASAAVAPANETATDADANAAEADGTETAAAETDDSDDTDDERGEPHVVQIRNVTDETRSLEVTILDGNEPIFEEEVELPGEEHVDLEVYDAEQIGLRLESGGSLVQTTVAPSGIAGEQSGTTVTLHEGGIQTESGVVQRVKSDIDVDDKSFDVLEGSCAGGDVDHATVDLDGSTVRVEGGVETPTPCHLLSLSEATVGDDGVLEVVVSVDGQDDGFCVQCLGEVEYEATISLTDAPDDVQVIHEANEERRTVAALDGGR